MCRSSFLIPTLFHSVLPDSLPHSSCLGWVLSRALLFCGANGMRSAVLTSPGRSICFFDKFVSNWKLWQFYILLEVPQTGSRPVAAWHTHCTAAAGHKCQYIGRCRNAHLCCHNGLKAASHTLQSVRATGTPYSRGGTAGSPPRPHRLARFLNWVERLPRTRAQPHPPGCTPRCTPPSDGCRRHRRRRVPPSAPCRPPTPCLASRPPCHRWAAFCPSRIGSRRATWARST